MGVSRTVLREAISILEARGLLRSQGGSGTYVVEQELAPEGAASPAGVWLSGDYSKLDFCRFRLAIDLACIRLAAMKINDDDLDRLSKNLQRFKEAIRLKRFDQGAAIDAEFHALIVEMAGVKMFTELYRAFRGALVETIAMLPAIQSRAWEAVVEHERVGFVLPTKVL